MCKTLSAHQPIITVCWYELTDICHKYSGLDPYHHSDNTLVEHFIQVFHQFRIKVSFMECLFAVGIIPQPSCQAHVCHSLLQRDWTDESAKCVLPTWKRLVPHDHLRWRRWPLDPNYLIPLVISSVLHSLDMDGLGLWLGDWSSQQGGAPFGWTTLSSLLSSSEFP